MWIALAARPGSAEQKLGSHDNEEIVAFAAGRLTPVLHIAERVLTADNIIWREKTLH